MVAPAGHLTEHGVDAVQPRGRAVAGNEEELTAAGVGCTGFGHGNGARFVVETVVGFVGDGVAVLLTVGLGNAVVAVAVPEPLGGVAARAVAVGEIAALNHEVVDNPMEDGAVVVPVLDEEFEVLNVNRGRIRVQLDGDRPAVGAAVPLQLKVNNICLLYTSPSPRD